MNRILQTEQAVAISQSLLKKKKKLVLVGGCFDILHIGHVKFLQQAKAEGDILMIMLEHDHTIKKTKGKHRPVNTQQDRAEMLASLACVDYVLMLPDSVSNEFYNGLVNQIKPAIIATTAGDPYRIYKENQAKRIGAKVIDVIQPIMNQSTTRVITILNEL